jgi:hypothetical protein
MSILNLTSDGNYPEFIALARMVAREGSIKEQDLLDFCGASPVEDKKWLRAQLARWSEMNLFRRSEGYVEFVRPLNCSHNHPDWNESLATECLQLVFTPDSALPLWGEDSGTSADFVRALTWLLCQDSYLPWMNTNEAQQLEDEQRPGAERFFQNDTRWNGLRGWASFFGFTPGQRGGVLIDPTTAIRRVLPDVFGDSQELPALAFMEALADVMPILDGGSYRREVEQVMKPSTWPQPRQGQLSMSTSFSLKRLSLERVLELQTRADAGEGLVLGGQNLRDWGRFTHVRWMGAIK